MSEFKIIGTIDTLISTKKKVKFSMNFENKYKDSNEKEYVLFEVIKEEKDKCKIVCEEDEKEKEIESKEFIAIKKKVANKKFFIAKVNLLDKLKECKNEGKKIQITIQLQDKNNKTVVIKDEINVKEVEIAW